MRGLANKGVLITGATSGIGLATAHRFLEEGARVFINGRDGPRFEAALRSLEDVGSVAGAVADVRHEADVERLVGAAEAWLGRIEVLINNAGIGHPEDFLSISAATWDETLDVNLRGMFLVGQAVARRMVERGVRGAIVNMSSTNGLVGELGHAHYDASKGGVTLLTKTMALELGRYGIRVNAVCPGFIRTPLTESNDDEAFFAHYASDLIPLGRVGNPDEIAAVYAFLASDEASFVHGACLVVDGGQIAG